MKSKENNLVTITRKIQILLHEKDEDKINEQYQMLFDWKHQVFKAANTIVNNQWFTHVFGYKIKASEGYEKASEAKDIVKKVYDTSLMNSSYQAIAAEFPDLPSSVRAALNMQVVKKFNSDLLDVMKGKKTLSNYRFGMPIPFNANKDFEKVMVGDKEEYTLEFYRGIKFILHFGADKSNNRSIVDRIHLGEYKFCDSAICVDDSKMFLLLTIQFPKNNVSLDYEKVVATNLGMNCPIFMTTSTGDKRKIGSQEEFWNVRKQFQKRYTKIQESLTTAKAGHGRTRKLKALDRLKKVEANFATTYNHKLSKEIVMFCVKNGIGTIKTEDLLGAGKTLNKEIVLRNWSYFQLQTFIEYKAKMYNVRVIKPSPKNITRMCNCCKNISESSVNLEKRMYICVNDKCAKFNVEVDVDENASLNLLATEVKEKAKA